jgi:hypothetical protein
LEESCILQPEIQQALRDEQLYRPSVQCSSNSGAEKSPAKESSCRWRNS